MKAMSNSKHNTLKRLAELYLRFRKLAKKELANGCMINGSYSHEVEQLFIECMEFECEELNCQLNVIKQLNPMSNGKLWFIGISLELAIYKLAWGKESFNGLVDSLIKSDYDESE